MSNPLLSLSCNELPPFSSIKPEHIEPAISEILKKNRETLKILLENSERYTWDNLVWPLEVMEGELDDMWSIVSHLNSVVNTPKLHKAYQSSICELTLYHTEMRQNEKLYQAFESIAKGEEFTRLNVAQKKVIENNLRNFKLSGIALPKDKQEEFKQLNIKT